METTKRTPALLTTVRDEFRDQLAQRAARKELRRDLATYTTPAEIADLEATLDRYDESDVAEIRSLLFQHRAA